MNKVIALFGSYRPLPGDIEYTQAYTLGKVLAEHNFSIVNGGNSGIMEASARGSVESGGKTLGIILKGNEHSTNKWIQHEIIADSLYDRIRLLIEESDGIIALPGGTGTLAELGVAWDLLHKNIVKRPPLACLGSFWNPVSELIASLYPQIKEHIRFFDSENAIVEYFVENLKER